jgi:hypothetical protein
MKKSVLFAAVLAVAALAGCGGGAGSAKSYAMSIDSSPLYTGQTVDGCPGYVPPSQMNPNQTVQTTYTGTGSVDSWMVFDGWDGATLLSGSLITNGFSYGPSSGVPGPSGSSPDYIQSKDNKTFTGKISTVATDKDTNLTVTETNTVTVKFDDFGSELKGSIQYVYERTCQGGTAGMCDSNGMKPISCQSGSATFVGRQVQSDTVSPAPGY